jgi:trigger factor
MNIELQHTGNLTATIKIDLSPADYEEKVMKVLKDYQRKAQMPGFRPGKAPFGITKKLYGQAVTADEINKLLGETLESFVKEQKLSILGNPLPNEEKTPEFDFNEAKEVSFYFDLGLQPEFEISLENLPAIPYYNIEISDEAAGKYLEDLRQRNGELSEAEVAEKGDLLKGDFAELDAEGNLKEGGITSTGSIKPEVFANEAIQAMFMGVKSGDVVKFNPMEASGNVTDVAAMLGIDKEEAERLESEFNFTVTSIQRMIPAEVNADLFEKIYPGVEIADEAELLAQIKKDAAGSFVTESDKKFFNDAVKVLLEESGIQLPDEFLKRWLIDVNQGKTSAEEIQNHYNDYARSMRWQLIENRMIKEYGIEVTEEDIKNVFRGYFQRPGSSEMDEEMMRRIDGIVDSFMKNKEDVRRINDQIFEQKLMAILKEKITTEVKSMNYEDFVKMASEK